MKTVGEEETVGDPVSRFAVYADTVLAPRRRDDPQFHLGPTGAVEALRLVLLIHEADRQQEQPAAEPQRLLP